MPENKQRKDKRPVKLLLVDDEKGFVEVLAKRLKKRGIQATSALSGAEAIQVLRRNDFDVALLDLKLEDMDGIEILKIFKKMDPLMPVIMLTGHGSREAAREGLRMGAFDYLNKPHEISELTQKIEIAARHRRKEV